MLEKLNVLKVTVENGFYVLVIPNGEYHDFILAHEDYGVYEHMFGCEVENDDEAVELALSNIECGNYIQYYIDDYFD